MAVQKPTRTEITPEPLTHGEDAGPLAGPLAGPGLRGAHRHTGRGDGGEAGDDGD